MRTIYLKIKVPSWVPTRYDMELFKRHIKFKLNPPKCEKCKKKLEVRRFYYGHRVSGKYYGYDTRQMFAMQSGVSWCQDCMKKYVHSLEKKKGTCDICMTKDVDVMGYHFSKENNIVITFLWNHWNGHEFCMKCIDGILDKGTKQTDIYRLKGNKTIPIFS